jgi:hypothetical protein
MAMKPAEFARFRAVMTGLAKVYERELDGPLLDAYWLALRAWPLADFEAAAAHLMATSTFMPRPAEFTALRRATRMTPAEAWELALKACPGWRYGPVHVDPAIDRAVHRVGGYKHIAMEPLDKQHFTMARFIAAYEEVVAAAEVRAALPALAAPAELLPGPQE